MKLFYLKLYFILSLSLLSHISRAQVEASLDLENPTVGDHMRLSLIIEGRPDQIPEFPQIKNLRVLGQSQANNYSSINGLVKSHFTLVYTFVAYKEGTYTIPPFKVKISGKEQESNPVTFTVGKASSSTSPGGVGQGKENQGSQNFVKRTLSKNKVYVGEPILVTTKFLYQSDIRNGRTHMSKLDNFRAWDFKTVEKRENYKGSLYKTATLKRALVPLKSGNYELDPDTVEAQFIVRSERNHRPRDPFEAFFNGPGYKVQSKSLATESAKIEVLPIPDAGRPGDYQGLVGNFRLHSHLSTKELKEGETTTLTITIAGFGLLDGAKAPNLKLPSSVKVYADKPVLEEKPHSSKGIFSRKVFKFALVPTVQGEVDLGSYEESYFSPEEKTFKSLTTKLGTIKVAKGEAVAKSSVVASAPGSPLQKEVEATGNDLVDIKRDYAQLLQIRDSSFGKFFFYFFWILLLGNVVLIVVKRFNLFSPQMTAKKRHKLAYSSYQTGRKELDKLVAAGETSQLVEQYSNLLREYLGHKFDLKSESLTVSDLKNALAKTKLNEEIQEEILGLMKHLDKVSYASMNTSLEAHKKNISMIDHLIKKVESHA